MSCEGCPSQGKCGKNSETCGIQSNPDNHIKNIITVMSGKGGVGKSTVTVMLAKAMAKKGLKVGIMDADITGPSIPRLLALTNQHAYGNEKQQLIPIESKEGIKVMSLNFLVQSESDPVIWRGPVIGGVVKQFYTDVVWGDLDVLLIDMPPGTGDVALTIMQSIPVQGVVMVSTPQPMVSMIVEKACHMCEKMEVKVLGIIENMAYLECPNCEHLFSDTLRIPYTLRLPLGVEDTGVHGADIEDIGHSGVDHIGAPPPLGGQSPVCIDETGA